jgi:hypothetical protein
VRPSWRASTVVMASKYRPDSTAAQSAHVIETRGNDKSTKREAFSPAEFAASCGRHPSWAYRLLYGGKVKALTDLGRILIPASELERVLATATPYNPKPRPLKAPAMREAPRGEEESGHRVATPIAHGRATKPCDIRLEAANHEC